MTSPHRTAFAVHPVRRVGSWLSDHRQHHARARFGLAELGRAVDDVLAVWPVDGGEALEVDQGPAGLHELCLKRDIFADAVVLLSAMSVEAFLNYYGVIRLGERQFYAHFEMLGAEKKLRVLLLTCDGLAVEYPDPLVAALRTVMGRRNRLAHPKAKEVAGDVPLEQRAGDPLPESVSAVFHACTEFFRLFVEAVPEAAHLVPEWRAAERGAAADRR